MGVARQPVPAARERTDAEIIRQVGTNPAAFAIVFDRYYDAINAFASRRLGPDLADDVASETFLVAFDRWRRYDPTHSSARPWLFGIASRLIAHHQRSEVRRYEAISRAAAADVPTNDRLADQIAVRLDARAVRGRLASALKDIAAADREVLLLVAWAELSCEDTARALGIPSGTARSRLHRARKRLQAALGGANPIVMREEWT